MTTKTQKQKERHHLDMVLSCTGIHAEVEESERPDFILTLDGRKVGLEVRVLSHNAMKTSQANCERHVKPQLQAFLKNLARPLGVSVSLRENLTLFVQDTKAINGFVKKLCSYITDSLTKHGTVTISTSNRALLSKLGFTELAALAISELETGEQPYVSIAPVIMHLGSDTTMIRAALEEKELNLAEYQRETGTPQQWLLLVTHEDLSQPISAETVPTAVLFKTGFERIYVLDVMANVVKQLKTAPGLRAPPAPTKVSDTSEPTPRTPPSRAP